MQKSNDDCFYFLTASCGKGHTCPYRHNPVVLTCNVMCPAWLRGNCIDPSCSLRHSAVQRPAVSSGISCFYENTPMGCLKLDCTFVHLRPRPNSRNSSTLRPSTTNLVNKDPIKPTTVSNSPSTTPNPPTPIVETPPTPEIPSTTVKTEPLPRRIAIPTESTTHNVIAAASEDIKTQSRVVGNRNVVIAETTSVPNRTVVQRVVVSSNPTNSSKTNDEDDSDIDLDDLIEQENDTKKTNSPIDISFPCSAPSILNRLFMSSKQSPSGNSTKPIRLNRDRLPATKITISNSTNSNSSSPNGEKISAGTGLPQDDDRRTSRLERFKKKPISPPRTVLNSSLSITTRNVISSKRPASEQSINDSPPAKRLSSQQENNNTRTIGDLCSPPSRRTHERHRRRRRSSSSSPSRPTYSSPSSMNPSAWHKEVDEFLAKTTQPKLPLPTTSVLPKPVPLLSLRPRYIPPPPHIPRHPSPLQRPRQPLTVAIQRPLAPVISPSSKSIEKTTPLNIPSSVPSPTILKNDDENLLLESDELTDVVDTFALIDEALLEADHLLELM